MKYKDENGFSVVELAIVLAVVGLVGFIGWRVMQSRDNASTSNNKTSQNHSEPETSPYVAWDYMGGEKWGALDPNPPECSQPLTIQSPMDVSKATSVLYPGQVRGGDFKPHGGMGVDGGSDTKVDVTMSIDGYLYRGSNYIQDGEVQYSIDIIHPCGIMVRYGHLATLGPEIEKYISEIPQTPDSRTTKFKTNAFIKKGTLVATEVGFRKNNNAFFDFGVYDLRRQNEASKDPAFAEEQLRKADKEQSYYAICWLDMLSGDDKAAVKSLPARDGQMGKTSDYCAQ